MIMEFSIVGSQKILLKILKATVHAGREKSCWRERFDSYRQGSGKSSR